MKLSVSKCCHYFILLLISVCARDASSTATVIGVSFLGYLHADHKGESLTAIIELDGIFDGVPTEWRATRQINHCGGTNKVDFFDASEIPKGMKRSSQKEQVSLLLRVLLPPTIQTGKNEDALFLCYASKSSSVMKWHPLGRPTQFKLPSGENTNYVLNEGLFKSFNLCNFSVKF